MTMTRPVFLLAGEGDVASPQLLEKKGEEHGVNNPQLDTKYSPVANTLS